MPNDHREAAQSLYFQLVRCPEGEIIDRIKAALQSAAQVQAERVEKLEAYYEAAEAWITLLATGNLDHGKEKHDWYEAAKKALEG